MEEKRPLKPRIETAHLLASILATSTPGTIRSSSGTLVAPERRMSSGPMTNTAAAASATRCGRLDTEVTSTSISSSRLSLVKSTSAAPWASAEASVAAVAAATSPASDARDRRRLRRALQDEARGRVIGGRIPWLESERTGAG